MKTKPHVSKPDQDHDKNTTIKVIILIALCFAILLLLARFAGCTPNDKMTKPPQLTITAAKTDEVAVPSQTMLEAETLSAETLSNEDRCLQELLGWKSWALSWGSQITLIRELCSNPESSAEIIEIKASVKTGSERGNPTRAADLLLTGMGSQDTLSTIKNELTTSKELAAHKGIVTIKESKVNPAGSNQIFKLQIIYKPRRLLQKLTEEDQNTNVNDLIGIYGNEILPIENPIAAGATEVKRAMIASEFTLKSLKEIPSVVLSNTEALLGLYTFTVGGTASLDICNAFINELENNPYLQISDLLIKKRAGSENYELAIQIQWPIWNNETYYGLARKLLD